MQLIGCKHMQGSDFAKNVPQVTKMTNFRGKKVGVAILAKKREEMVKNTFLGLIQLFRDIYQN